jgi:lipoyl-dependent peroxiredoxin
MTDRKATTVWQGGLEDGSGTVTFDSSGAVNDQAVTWPARAGEPEGHTSPEELIAGAHSACFSMAFSARLGKNGTPPERLETSAVVTFVPGQGITKVALTTVGTVPGIDEATFTQLAEDAKENCPVSQLMAGNTELSVAATLR